LRKLYPLTKQTDLSQVTPSLIGHAMKEPDDLLITMSLHRLGYFQITLLGLLLQLRGIGKKGHEFVCHHR
jgi:hypothetical protein